ncbi:MAG: hypothetical protein IH991_08080 [Planctomycetes bacterium]|nr:hypothetical protein [Planctomycetota bacterium]
MWKNFHDLRDMTRKTMKEIVNSTAGIRIVSPSESITVCRKRNEKLQGQPGNPHEMGRVKVPMIR